MPSPSGFDNRKYFFFALFIAVGLIFVLRLGKIQLIEDKYKESADINALRYIYEYPARGLIYDRNGKIIVYNEATFDLMIVPYDVKAFDTLALANMMKIEIDDFRKRMKKAVTYSGYLPTVFDFDLPISEYSRFQEESWKYPGFFIQSRTIRKYPRPIAAHTVGYLSEVPPYVVEKDKYYKPGDYIGISGLERFYEKDLRGRKGLKVMVADVHNRVQGSYMNGKYDSAAVAGKNLYSTIDAELQEYGEKLMKNKRGGIVAIEPATGEILAIISSPTYDPNLLVGRKRSSNMALLLEDKENHVLYHRATMTRYPPGSTFKLVNGLAGLQEGILDEHTSFFCGGGYNIGNHTVGCHNHPSPLVYKSAVQYSCNTWFCWAFKKFVDNPRFSSPREGYYKWRQHVLKLGFGRKLGIDLPTEYGGYIPEPEFYDKSRGNRKWRANSIISVAIGQGEVGASPLQLANLAVIVANRGYYITPHLVKAIGSPDSLNTKFMQKHESGIDRKYLEWTADGMELAVTAGTARKAVIPGIIVCGKTGTAQDPPRKNHSVFIAFAPKKDPKIAIAVLIENCGYGGDYAAPIASLMIEYYINRKILRTELETSMMNAVLLNSKK